MSDGPITFLLTITLLFLVFLPYLYFTKRKQARVQVRKNEALALGQRPVAQHPLIDQGRCIGCSACVIACPEHALGMIDGIAELVYPGKCIGHGICAEACPVSGIKIVLDSAKSTIELPVVDENYQSNITNLFLIGELGGMALIRNAIFQGRTVIEGITETLRKKKINPHSSPEYDVIIVGAGAAGLSAALMANKNGLKYLLLEREASVGGAILSYPRQKLVMTTPVEIPQYGLLRKRELSKEELLAIWNDVVQKNSLVVTTGQRVDHITTENSLFTVTTESGSIYKGRHIVLALGRRGTPRKLNVPGENSPKVSYGLIEAVRYKHSHIIVVGAGDSGVEAAIALSKQVGTHVTVINRGSDFSRINPKNRDRILEAEKNKNLVTYYDSGVQEIQEKRVLVKSPTGIVEIENDYVFVFAGGELPTPFLKKIGIEFVQKNREIAA